MRIINKIGNEELLNREKSIFLCSKHAPYSLYDKVFGWVDSLTADDCVICFNSSELEDEVMRALLVNKVPTILVVMNRFTLFPPTHQRWTVWQDKILLRMFYEDMGLHAIKKQLRRTYISVRNRIKGWINQRLKSIEVRKGLTDEWDRAGVEEGQQYASLTDIITQAWSGKNTRQYKHYKAYSIQYGTVFF